MSVAERFSLAGKKALVTGASKGIGTELCSILAEAGADIVAVARDVAGLADVRAAVEAKGRRCLVIPADLGSPTEPERAAREALAAWGTIDILVNNAGVQHRVPMLELDVADWERVLSTDLTSAFLVGRAAARHMIGRGHGKIINICSVQTDLARPTIAPYVAAKGGLRNLTRAMTAEWAGSGLQINGIAPGYIHTEMTQNLVDDPAFNAWILGRTPAARWGTVQDLAGPAVWLASSGSDFVNGQTIFIDGGMTVVV